MPESPRGEVWLVDLGYVAKVRPCLVLSVRPSDTERALVTLVPHTTKPRESRFEVPAGISFLRTGVFDAQSLVTVPFPKLLKKLGALPANDLAQVENAVASWLGLRV